MSGMIPSRIKKNWNGEGGHAIVKDIGVVVASDLEGESMPAHVDVDDFIFGIADVYMSAGEQAHRILHKVVVIGKSVHDGHSRC